MTYTVDQFVAARREHAWLLRAEGMTYRNIARRMGVNKDTAARLVAEMSNRVMIATRRCKVYWI